LVGDEVPTLIVSDLAKCIHYLPHFALLRRLYQRPQAERAQRPIHDIGSATRRALQQIANIAHALSRALFPHIQVKSHAVLLA